MSRRLARSCGVHRRERLPGKPLAGELGAATAARTVKLGWVVRVRRSRAVHVTEAGDRSARDVSVSEGAVRDPVS